jgi:O-antigen/teichoic acid export membrane protein
MIVSINKLSRDTSIMFVNRGIGLLSGVILVMFFTRKLGVAEYGVYSLVTTLVGVLSITADFGLSMLAIREVAKDHLKFSKYYLNGLIGKLFLFFLNILLLYAIILFLNKSSHVNTALFAGLLLLITTTFSDYNLSFLASLEKFKLYSFLQISETFLWFCIGLILIHHFQSAFVLIIGISFIKCIFLIISLFLLKKYFYRQKTHLSLTFIISYLKEAFPFFIFMIFGVIYFSIDAIMIAKMLENSEYYLGIYLAAVKLITILLIIPDVISKILYPTFSRLYVNSPRTLKSGVNEVVIIMWLLSIPVTIGTIFLAHKIIILFFGVQYRYSILPLQILICILPFRFNNFIFGTTLTSAAKQTYRTISASVCVLVNITLNFFLIPLYDIVGASIATVFTELVLFGMYFYYMGENIRMKDLLKPVWRPLIGSCGFVIFLLFFQDLNLFFSIMFSIMIYIIIMYFLRGFQHTRLPDILASLKKT